MGIASKINNKIAHFSPLRMATLYISMLFPKDEKLFLFGSWFGTKYADNAKYLLVNEILIHRGLLQVHVDDNLDGVLFPRHHYRGAVFVHQLLAAELLFGFGRDALQQAVEVFGQLGSRVDAVGINVEVHHVGRLFLPVRLVAGALAHTRHIFLRGRALLLRYEVEALVFIEAGRAPDSLCFFWHIA